MSHLLYRNPRLLILAIGVIIAAGLTSFFSLPQMEDPVLTKRFGLVRTVFPGADAERVETQVTRQLEEALFPIKGVKEVRSYSLSGFSSISVELREEIKDVEPIWSRVRDEISEASKTLPEASLKPQFTKAEMRAFAVMVSLDWNDPNGQPDLAILRRLGEDLEAVIRSVNGTDVVEMFGEQDEEFLVEVTDATLQRTGLTIGNLSQQIRNSESKGSAGIYRSGNSEIVIEVDQDLDSIRRLGATPIQYGPEGAISRLDQIAAISKSLVKPAKSIALIDGSPSLLIAASVRDESRIDQWNTTLINELDAFRKSLPATVQLNVIFNQNEYVQGSLTQLGINLLVGTIAVIVVVFFLMGWRCMIVVGMALPLSALIVITGMRFLDIPIHQMSITGLIIALGLLIDNAIVMVDEVSREIRDGAKPTEAMRKTIRHLALPLFGSTLTTTLAFMPIVILPGAAGEFVGSIALSVILAIAASFTLSMTIVPAVTAMFGKPKTDSTERNRFFDHGISSEKLKGLYRKFLIDLFRFPVWGVVFGVALPLIGFHQLQYLPEQFFPPANRDQIHIELELSSGTTLEHTQGVAEQMRLLALENQSVQRFHWFLGESAPAFFYNLIPSRKNSPHYAQAFVELSESADSGAIIRSLQDLFDREFPEGRILVRQLEQGPPFEAPLEVRLFGPDISVLQSLGNQVRLIMSETRQVVHTRADLSESVPKLALQLDEYEARLAGLSHREVEQQLYSSLIGLESGSVVQQTETIPIRVNRIASNSMQSLSGFEFRPNRPMMPTPLPQRQGGVALSSLGTINLDSEVASIPRIDGRRVNEIRAFITADTLPSVVVDEFKQRLAASDFELPTGYTLQYMGESEKRKEAVGNLMTYIPLLIALMIATLVASFRSFRIAFIIALVGGLSIGLGLGSLWLFGFPFGFMGVVGTMGLVGVAVNDAIVVMAGIRDNPKARKGDPTALADIVIRRTRHIVATTLTTISGFTPLILGGGTFWPPVAITIAGGVGGATILALCFVPCIYLVFIGKASQPLPFGKSH